MRSLRVELYSQLEMLLCAVFTPPSNIDLHVLRMYQQLRTFPMGLSLDLGPSPDSESVTGAELALRARRERRAIISKLQSTFAGCHILPKMIEDVKAQFRSPCDGCLSMNKKTSLCSRCRIAGYCRYGACV